MISFKLYLKKLPSSDEIALVSKGDRQFAIVLKSNGLEYYTNLTGASDSWKNKQENVVIIPLTLILQLDVSLMVVVMLPGSLRMIMDI